MSEGRQGCPHGQPVDRVISANGWLVPYADTCMLCAGEPAGIPYKDPEIEHWDIEPGAVFGLKPAPPWFGVYSPGGELLAIFPSRRTAAVYARGPHCARYDNEPYVYAVYGSASQDQPKGIGAQGFVAD